MNKKNQVKRIFDSIAHRYDLLNHLLSFGTDIYWRNRAISLSNVSGSSIVLDLACGTGDFAITSRKKGKPEIIGADLSLPMLKIFNQKEDWSKGRLIQMTAEQPAIKDNALTNITVAFGVRNFYNIAGAFKALYNLLRPEGKFTILEFRLPDNRFFAALYNFYFNKVLPKIGKAISKDKEAYQYLPDSVKEFDTSINLTELLRQAGFKNISVHKLTFGIAQVVIAVK